MTNPLEECAQSFKNARGSIYEGAMKLYAISEQEAWVGQFSSFSEYVELECQISKSYASKLLKSWRFYVVEGGVSQDKLVGTDPEKLYLALQLPSGTPEERLEQAQHLSRNDIKQAVFDKGGAPCEHPHCDKRLQ